MTQIKDYLIVPVPEGAHPNAKAFITSIHSDDDLVIRGKAGGFIWLGALPEGDWSIVEIDERVAGEIVDSLDGVFLFGQGRKKIYFDYVRREYATITALESYSSLLKSKGYENVVLLKKK
jgi:hypothetical protein